MNPYIVAGVAGAAAYFISKLPSVPIDHTGSGNPLPPIDHSTDAAKIASLQSQITEKEKYLAQLQTLRDNADSSTDPGVYQDEINLTIRQLNDLGAQLSALENGS